MLCQEHNSWIAPATAPAGIMQAAGNDITSQSQLRPAGVPSLSHNRHVIPVEQPSSGGAARGSWGNDDVDRRELPQADTASALPLRSRSELPPIPLFHDNAPTSGGTKRPTRAVRCVRLQPFFLYQFLQLRPTSSSERHPLNLRFCFSTVVWRPVHRFRLA